MFCMSPNLKLQILSINPHICLNNLVNVCITFLRTPGVKCNTEKKKLHFTQRMLCVYVCFLRKSFHSTDFRKFQNTALNLCQVVYFMNFPWVRKSNAQNLVIKTKSFKLFFILSKTNTLLDVLIHTQVDNSCKASQ